MPSVPNAGGFGYWTYLNNGANVFQADTAQALAIHAAHPNLTWAGLYAYGGNDEIIRDRSGGYALGPGFWDFTIDGGSGFDTVSYELSATGVSADLAAGWAKTLNGGGKVYKYDDFNSIEGLAGTGYNDTIWGDSNANELKGLNSNDYIQGGAGNDTIDGGNHNDTLGGGSGSDNIEGGHGHDSIDGGSSSDILKGEGGNDTIDGDSGNDSIDAGSGNDTVSGGLGNDTIVLGSGDDEASGGSGYDTFYISGNGDNTIDGGAHADTVYFLDNTDVDVSLFAGTATRAGGTDSLTSIANVVTSSGDDFVLGSTGSNNIQTNGGDDTVATAGGNDTVSTGAGDDFVWGYGGEETISGGSGDDTLRGGDGDDEIGGGSGEDLIVGGEGSDTLAGGADADTFKWENGHLGMDVIADFNVYQDKLAFEAGFFDGGPGSYDAEDVLVANNIGGGFAVLSAKTVEAGWTSIALLYNTNVAVLNQKIANGSIFDVEVNDALDGGPGGLQGVQRGGAFDAEWGMIA